MGNCGECENRWMCNEDPNTCTVGTEPALMTNADRIRAMSGEELEIFFGHRGFCALIQVMHETWCYNRAACKNCIIEWLKQPAEG